MSDFWQRTMWSQFGAAIDMLENAIRACPEPRWSDRSRQPEFWYTTFHTLFWLDYYLSEEPDAFAPPAPYTPDEFDPAGILPAEVYPQAQMLQYLEHGREKCRRRIAALTTKNLEEPLRFDTRTMSTAEWLFYNMRHVQHHAAQLHTLLRQEVNDAPRWVSRARVELVDEARRSAV